MGDGECREDVAGGGKREAARRKRPAGAGVGGVTRRGALNVDCVALTPPLERATKLLIPWVQQEENYDYHR